MALQPNDATFPSFHSPLAQSALEIAPLSLLFSRYNVRLRKRLSEEGIVPINALLDKSNTNGANEERPSKNKEGMVPVKLLLARSTLVNMPTFSKLGSPPSMPLSRRDIVCRYFTCSMSPGKVPVTPLSPMYRARRLANSNHS